MLHARKLHYTHGSATWSSSYALELTQDPKVEIAVEDLHNRADLHRLKNTTIATILSGCLLGKNRAIRGFCSATHDGNKRNCHSVEKGHTAEDGTEVLANRAMHLDVIVKTER